MHGLGDSSEGFKPVFSVDERNPMHRTTRIRLLNAPRAAVTIYEGSKVNSWYDTIKLSTSPDSYSINDVEMSSKYIKQVIRKEMEKLDGNSERIYLGGFGQGASLA